MKRGLTRGLALSLTACLLFALLPVDALAAQPQPDSTGIIWLPEGYQEYMGGIYGFDDGRLRVTQYVDGKFLHGYVDENMELVIPCIYELTECFSEGVACVKKDGAVYFIDTAGNKVFDTPIRSGAAILPRFVNGYAMLYGTPGGTAVMDRTGKVRFYVKEGDSIGNTVFNDRVWFRSGYYYGYLDTYGNIVVPAEYDDVSDFYDGYACVRKGTTLSFIDTMGNVVGTLPFPVKEGTRAYSYVSCWGSQDGAFIIETNLETEVEYSSKILVSKNGEVLLPGFYSDIKSGYGSGIFTVYDRSDNHSGMYYVRSDGTFINPKSYLNLEPFKEGLARVSVSMGIYNHSVLKNWGFIDMDGNEIVPTIYQDADDFSEGLAGVKQDGKWGFVDKTGQVVISPQFDYVGKFHAGAAPANDNGKWGLIDTFGNWILLPIYDNLKWMDSRSTPCWKVSQDGRSGLLARVPEYSHNAAKLNFTGWMAGDMGYSSLYYNLKNNTDKTDIGCYAVIAVSDSATAYRFDYRLAPHETLQDSMVFVHVRGYVDFYDLIDKFFDFDDPDMNPGTLYFVPFDTPSERDLFLETIPWNFYPEMSLDERFSVKNFTTGVYIAETTEGDQWLSDTFDGASRIKRDGQ